MASVDAKTYAAALRASGGDARKIWQSLRDVDQALATVPRLKQLVVGIGTRPSKIRNQELNRLFAGQPNQVKRLFDLLATDGAVSSFSDIRDAYTNLLKEEGFVPVAVETAVPLGAASLTGLLKAAQVDRRKALLEVIEEPELIGGVRVTVGDRSYDFSLGGALDQLATALEVRT